MVVVEIAEHALHLGVALKELDGEIAGRESRRELGVGLHGAVDGRDRLLDVGTQLHMDVACVRILHLVDLYHGVEKLVDPPSRGGYRRHHRHSEHLAEVLVVECGMAFLELVIHVEAYHHAAVHVDELCGEVEVSLKVRCHDGVDDHVGHLLPEVTHHVEFLGGIGREGICAGKVYDVEAIALIMEHTLLCPHSDTGIVAHTLMGARHHVEERRLSAVGVAYQCDVDYLVFPYA